MFLARFLDAQCDDNAVAADLHPVDQPRHQVKGVERGRPPRVQLRLGLRHKTPPHRTLARPPRADVRAQRFQTPAILAGRHADEQLLDDAPVERVGVRKGLDRGQRHFLAVAPDTRPAHRDLAPAQHDFAGRMARPRGAPLGLMRIPRTAHGHAILLQHRVEHLQPRCDDQRLELRLGLDQDVDQGQVALRLRI